MFLHESSRRHSSDSRNLSPLEELLGSIGEVRLLGSHAQEHENEIAYPVTGFRLKIACHQDVDPASVFKIRDAMQSMLIATESLAASSKELQSRDETLSLISSAMINFSESDPSFTPFVSSLLPTAKFALFKAGDLIVNHQFTPQAIGSSSAHFDTGIEGSVRVLDGELYFYQSDPYQLLIESAKPIDAPIKALINLFLSQIGDKERQAMRAEAERKSDRMERLANQDPLTNLANRRGLTKYLETLLGEQSHHGASHTLLHIDLDYFKRVNDSLGHAVGDELLIRVARILRTQIRSQDLAARVGGDEFVVLCPFFDTEESVSALADRLVKEIGRPQIVKDHSCRIGASIGIARRIQSEDVDVARWIEDADLALYSSKEDGREQFSWYHERLRLPKAM